MDFCDFSFQNESPTATELKKMLLVLNFPKPPANIPADVFFTKVQARVSILDQTFQCKLELSSLINYFLLQLKEVLSKAPPALLSEPLFTQKLTNKDWHTLEQFYNELYDEYRIRREMLLTRLDVTIQSFEVNYCPT